MSPVVVFTFLLGCLRLTGVACCSVVPPVTFFSFALPSFFRAILKIKHKKATEAGGGGRRRRRRATTHNMKHPMK
jgi:hypothetical protein